MPESCLKAKMLQGWDMIGGDGGGDGGVHGDTNQPFRIAD